MADPIAGYSGTSFANDPELDESGWAEAPACFEPSLEKLERSAEALAKSEREVKAHLQNALVDTLKTAALCLGGERWQSAPCIISLAQHVQGLLGLDELSRQYEKAAKDYEAELSAHLQCLDGLE